MLLKLVSTSFSIHRTNKAYTIHANKIYFNFDSSIGIEGLATCLRQELRPRGVDVSIVAAGEFAAGTAWLSESSMLEQVKKIDSLFLNKIQFNVFRM